MVQNWGSHSNKSTKSLISGMHSRDEGLRQGPGTPGQYLPPYLEVEGIRAARQ